MLPLSRCARNGTVVAAVATPADVPQRTAALARSVVSAGFGCLVVLPFEDTAELTSTDQLLLVLPAPQPALLPRAQWCEGAAPQYTFRRAQLHRMRLWRLVLSSGYSLLGVDASMRLTRNPLPAIESQRTQPELERGRGAPPDLVGKSPGWFLKEYVLAALWIRSTARTVALLEQVEARSWGAWDQL
eukprot:5127247-Prymnesium_polylepis.1